MSKKRKWNISLIIAIAAVLISSLSALISLQQSKIMSEQQELLIEQQEASVWPYLSNRPTNDYPNDTSAIFRYYVTNKGVGPAIIDDVIYEFFGDTITGYNLGKPLQKKYPHLKIIQTQNSTLDNTVLAPGESHKVITVMISKLSSDTIKLSPILNEIDFNYRLKYCYCSVYGKCWRVESIEEIGVSEECGFRENIR